MFLLYFSSKKHDIVIAEDSLLALLSIALKKLGKCKTVIFYSHGIDKTRFTNGFMNNLYRKLDNFSAIHSDYNWFLNRTMADLRKKQGIKKQTLFWIPSSIAIDTVKRKPNLFNRKIVFLGVLNDKNGAGILVDIVEEVKKKIPDVHLDIMGAGELFESIQKDIKKRQLQKHIKLLGLLEFKDFSQILTNYAVGIAPYEDRFDTLTSSSDLMKMRVYLAAGLPVVITQGFIFSNEIVENKLGYAVSFTVKDFAQAIIKLLTNPTLNLNLRKKALNYSRRFDVIRIYNKTFEAIITKKT